MAVDPKILKYQRLLIKMVIKFGEVATFRTHKAGKCDCFNPRFGVYDPMCPECVGTGNPNGDGKGPEFKDTRVLAIVTSPDDERFKDFSGGQLREYKKAGLFAYKPTVDFIGGYLGWLRARVFFDSRVTGIKYNLIWDHKMPQDEIIELVPGQKKFTVTGPKIFDIDSTTLAKHKPGLVNRPLSEVQNFIATGEDDTLILDPTDDDDKILIIADSVTIDEEGLYVVRHWVPYNKTSVYKPEIPDVWVGYNVKIGEYFYMESMHEVAEHTDHFIVKTRNNVEGGIYEAGYWTGLEVTNRYPELAPPASPVG